MVQLVEHLALHRAIADVGARRVGVAVKAELRVLVVEARRGIELVEDVAPLVRRIERGVDDREIAHLPDHLQVAQPLLVVLGQMLARPVDRLLRERIEACEILGQRGLLVVISLHDRAIELAHDLHALVRVGVVADDIAEADVMRDLVRLGVGRTAWSASRLAWMSPKMANRMGS